MRPSLAGAAVLLPLAACGGPTRRTTATVTAVERHATRWHPYLVVVTARDAAGLIGVGEADSRTLRCRVGDRVAASAGGGMLSIRPETCRR